MQEQLSRSSYRGAIVEEQLPSVSDAAIYNFLILNQKIAALRLLPWMVCMLKKQEHF
jgi:hypothetical protein